MNIEHLRAFATAVDAGAMGTAARRLHVTPSAVSQRIRALESETGSVLLQRTSPLAATESGGVILRAARQILLVEADAMQQLAGGSGGGDGLAGQHRQTVRLAVNADSLATWLEPLSALAAGWSDMLLHLEVRDQAEADSLLTGGQVMAAISSRRAAPAGCASLPLSSMRYTAVAKPQLVSGSGMLTADELRRMPVVDYGADDDLQRALLRRHGVRTQPPRHQVPGSREYVAAVRAGLGWGMVPDLQRGHRETELVVLPVADPTIEVPLYLHRWKIDSERLNRACTAIGQLAETGLR